MARLAIRREDKNEWEARAPLTPTHVARLAERGIEVVVQPSKQRVFDDDEYAEAGAEVREDLSECEIVLGVKEIPTAHLHGDRTYVYFSHTIKGQPYNMPMLRHVLDVGAALCDYECITDDDGLRLVAFGHQAGQAGAIDSLWTFGRRLSAEGHDTPFAGLQPAWRYPSLEAAREALRGVARELRERPLPSEIAPLTIGVTGNGRVAGGAWDVLSELDTVPVAPDDLAALESGGGDRSRVYEARLYPEHYVQRRADGGFSFEEYIRQPELYEPIIERHLLYLSVLINGIYWDERYPKLVTRAWLRDAWAGARPPKLRVIGDVTCDIRGAVESTVRATTPQAPTYLYDPETDEADPEAASGRGPLVLAVDNLPCELPREASESFGEALLPLIPELVDAHADGTLNEAALPGPLRRALIARHGALTAPFAGLSSRLPSSASGE
jgi:alpha-aminoadipic semialdehyde synthase